MTRTTNARVAGSAFLLYIAVGVTQMVVSSGTGSADGVAARLALFAQHAARVRVNVVLSLGICVTALVLAVALYGITRDEDREVAVLALSFRLGEGLLAAIAPLPTLGLLWLGTEQAGTGGPDAGVAAALGGLLLEVRGWNTTISATLFAVGSTLFSWLLLRGRLIPVPLAWLGVVASILLVVGLPLQLVEVLDGTILQLMWLPMAAFEIPLAFWLLIKGVRSPAPRPAG
jgi:hypothetical protein